MKLSTASNQEESLSGLCILAFLFLSVSLLRLSFLYTPSLEAKGLKDKCEMKFAITLPICVHRSLFKSLLMTAAGKKA